MTASVMSAVKATVVNKPANTIATSRVKDSMTPNEATKVKEKKNFDNLGDDENARLYIPKTA